MSNKTYPYQPIDVLEANLYEEIFPYTHVPKIEMEESFVPMQMPESIWITDTTFRDGQQSMSAFSVRQIASLFDFMHEIDDGTGIIRATEFFLYSPKDRKAVEMCMDKGYEFPEITSWIRADERDFELVKQMGIKETGLLMSCSDYHIFKKLKRTRRTCMEQYLSIIEKALEEGIVPRCHLEDITRADFYGFVAPLVKNIKHLGDQYGVAIKIRLCDTLGLGVPYPQATLPRSIPKMITAIRDECGISSENIEWHGHNDYHNVVTNATTAWMYGASSVNTTMFGIGERTGNCPLEAMLIEYAQLRDDRQLDLTILKEMRRFFEKEFDYRIDPKRPFVGDEFNLTKAGVHADGIMKFEAIYNSFDTKAILGRPVVIKVNQASGLAGVAAWINNYYELKEENKIDKHHPGVIAMKNWVEEEYKNGRTTPITDQELDALAKKHISFHNSNNTLQA
ncbi:MAG TPA: 2-isopropylmalate synthase [Eubacteriaceae bacterium]|nr:2-isopropylmalate synthase [Eubacteriaceae bacterium]